MGIKKSAAAGHRAGTHLGQGVFAAEHRVGPRKEALVGELLGQVHRVGGRLVRACNPARRRTRSHTCMRAG